LPDSGVLQSFFFHDFKFIRLRIDGQNTFSYCLNQYALLLSIHTNTHRNWNMTNKTIQRAIDIAGSQKKLADLCGVAQPTVGAGCTVAALMPAT
jgi:hypothetical protein